MSFKNPFATQTITIKIDGETGSYEADFTNCTLHGIYNTITDLKADLDSGEIFKDLKVYDESGTELSADDARKEIQKRIATFDDEGSTGSEPSSH